MVSARPQFEAACQLQEFAGLAQWECRELVPLRRVFDSLDQLQISMAGLAEWFRRWIVAPVYESSILSSRPKLGGSYKGITHGLQPCNASSSLAPSTKFGSGTRRQSAGLKSRWIRFNSVPSHQSRNGG